MVAVCVAAAEAAVTFFLSALPRLNPWISLLVDAVSMVLLTAPAFYLLWFHPLVTDISARRRTETALRESEKRLRLAQKTAGIGNWEWNLVTGRLYWSEENYRILGLDPQLIKPSFEAFLNALDPRDRNLVKTALEEASSGKKPYDVDMHIVRPDGEVRIINAKAQVEFDEAGKAVRMAGTVQDITERMRVEEALRKSESRLQEAQQLAHIGNWERDLETESVTWSDEVYRIFGFSPGSFIPSVQAFEASIHPDDLTDFLKGREQIHKHKQPAHIEHRIILPGGEVRFVQERVRFVVNDKGSVIRVIGTVQDITDSMQAEEQIEMLKHSVDVHCDGAYWMDTENKFVYVNDAGCRILGYSREELIGSPVTIVNPRATPEVMQQVWKRLRTEGYFTTESEHRRKDGSKFPVEIVSTYVQSGGREYNAGFARDITDRKRADAELLKFKLAFERSGEAIFLTNVDGRIVYVNPTFEKTYGYTQEEALGKTPRILKSGILDSQTYEKFWNALLSKQVITGEIINKTKDGRLLTVDSSANPVLDKNSNIIAFLAIQRDISERKLAEESLRESETRYRSLFEHSGDYVLVLEPREDGIPVIVDVNEAALSVHGYTREELLGEPITLLDHDLSPEVGNARIRSLEIDQGIFFNTCHRRKDGSIFHAEVHAQAVQLGTKTVIITVERDITERKRAEEALRESEERFRKIFEESQMGMVLTSSDFRFLRANAAFCAMVGYSEEELVGLKFSDVTHPEHIDQDIEHIKALWRGDIPSHHTKKRYLHKSGDIIWGSVVASVVRNSEGRPLYALAVIEDITERKRAEEKLREMSARNEALLASVPDIIMEVDFNKVYTWANQAGYEFFGNDVIGKEAAHYFVGDQRVYETVEPLFCGDEDIVYVESWQRRKDGEKRLLAWWCKVLKEDGKTTGALSTARDITELKRLQEHEFRAQRLEAAGQIAGQVAHDFNNLLGPLMAYPELIREDLPRNHPALDYLDAMEQAARRIADINQDLLTMGRRGHYTQHIVNINTVVYRVLKELENMPETLVCELDLCDDLMAIVGGEAQIHRVISNLLHNARDAVQNIGRITVRTQNYYIDEVSIAYGRVPKGEYVKLTVSDTGCGIPDDIAQRIFDPFFTTKQSDKKRGSGLGLSVVDAVVKDHGGYIDLSTQIGEGTSFYLYFPASRESVEQAELEHIAGGNEKVLVVDDDEVQRSVTKQLLMTLGYRVTTVETGEKAIEFLREHPHDLLVLDMIIPAGIDGAETYRRVLEFNPHQKAIIVSGFSETDRVLEAQKLGVGVFVKKPLTRRDLAAAVRVELDRRLEIAVT